MTETPAAKGHFGYRPLDTKKTTYVTIGTNLEGKKAVLGSWLGANESANYW